MSIRATAADIARLEAAGVTVGPATRLPDVPSGPADGEWNQPPVGTVPAKRGTKDKSTTIPTISWKAFGIPEPTAEYRFCERMWRLDYCWVDAKVALEIEGGIWKQGRHNRPKTMIAEMAKYNRLAVLGYRLIRATPDDVKDGSVFATIRQVLQL